MKMKTQLELPMADQKSDSSEAKLTLSLTGNPWTDFGIVSLCKELEASEHFLVKKPFLMENEVKITIDASNIETVKTWFNQTLRDKWNNIYHPSPIAKVLKRTPIQENGFIKPDEKILIDAAARKTIKEKLKRPKIEDEAPLVERRTNFIGLPGNIKTIRKKLDSMIHESVKSLINSTGRNLCEVSGLSFKKEKGEKVTQYANPFANKYHNHPTRGATSTANYTTVSPIHYLINLLTTLCPNIPFVRDTEITLILPVIPDLHLLSEVYARLIGSNNLKDFNDSEEIHTSTTNLRELRPPYDDYSLAIYIFHNIFYRFSEEGRTVNF